MSRPIEILLLGVFSAVAVTAQCFRASQPPVRVDFDRDGKADWEAYVYSTRDDSFPEPLPEYFLIRTDLRVGATARVLRMEAQGRVDFAQGQTISTNRPHYLSEPYHHLDVWLLRYRCSDVTPAEDVDGEFIGRSSVILGTKYTDPDTGDMTLGWFKFSRPSTEPGTAFTLESWAYNPIPNEPIKAGEPPDLPEPSFAWSEEGVTVSWPAKASMLRLETATSLTPPVQWQPVETGGTTSVILPQPAAGGAFFRLVAPEP